MNLIETCREAWNSSKRAEQPEYDDLIESYREMLSERAKPIMDRGNLSGDALFLAFETSVFDISHPRELPVEVKKELVKEAVKEKPAKKKPEVKKPEVKPKVKVVKSAKKLAEKKSTQKGAKKR